MSNTKITELTALAATPADADILEIVDDVAGTPTSKKITAGNLRGGLAASGANADITSMTGLSNDGIPLAKVANAASDGANSDITSLGAVSIPTINLTGGQIAFPATAVPSADANTLDDYEEGTWTPGVGDQTVVGAFSSEGKYVKIGNQVTINGKIAGATSIAGAASTYITGLPFAANSSTDLQAMGIGTNATYSVSIAVLAYSNSQMYICEGYAATASFTFAVTYLI